jgi:hypothetical protein
MNSLPSSLRVLPRVPVPPALPPVAPELLPDMPKPALQSLRPRDLATAATSTAVQDLPDLQANQADLDAMELQVPQVPLAGTLDLAVLPLRLHAGPALLAHQVPLDPQEMPVTLDPTERTQPAVATVHQESQDPRDLPGPLAGLVRMGPRATRDPMLSAVESSPDQPDQQAMPDHLDPLERLAPTVPTANLDRLDLKAPGVLQAPLELMASLAMLVLTASPAKSEKRVSAPSTAPWTEASSSKMELSERWPRLELTFSNPFVL